MAKKKVTSSSTPVSRNTHIAVVMDRSGSMASIQNDIIGGFNTFLKEQQKMDAPATITYSQFDTEYEMVHENIDIQKMPKLDEATYVPRGGTALLDSIGKTLAETKAAIKAKKINPDLVIVVIITDGEENASREYNQEQIKKLIATQTKKKDWDFVYLGANQDSFSEAGGFGFDKGSTQNWISTTAGSNAMFLSVGASMSDSRMYGKKSAGYFSDSDVKDVVKEIEDDVNENAKDKKESA